VWADALVVVDHRGLGWDKVQGLEALRENIRSAMQMWPDVRVEVDEVLACDERVIAFRDPFVVADGSIHRLEQFEPDARQAMIALFAELVRGQAPLGDRPPERHVAAR
jgi:hypothetical protein